MNQKFKIKHVLFIILMINVEVIAQPASSCLENQALTFSPPNLITNGQMTCYLPGTTFPSPISNLRYWDAGDGTEYSKYEYINNRFAVHLSCNAGLFLAPPYVGVSHEINDGYLIKKNKKYKLTLDALTSSNGSGTAKLIVSFGERGCLDGKFQNVCVLDDLSTGIGFFTYERDNLIADDDYRFLLLSFPKECYYSPNGNGIHVFFTDVRLDEYLSINAGDNREICQGQSTILGGIGNYPTISGGLNPSSNNTGIITWTDNYGNVINNSNSLRNPIVSPTVTTTYTLTVTRTDIDHTVVTLQDQVTVTVNPCLCEWPTLLNSDRDLEPYAVANGDHYTYSLFNMVGESITSSFCAYKEYTHTTGNSRILVACHQDGVLKNLASFGVTELHPTSPVNIKTANDNAIISFTYRGTVSDKNGVAQISSPTNYFATAVIAINSEGTILWAKNFKCGGETVGNVYGGEICANSSKLFLMGNCPANTSFSPTITVAQSGTYLAVMDVNSGAVSYASRKLSYYSNPSLALYTTDKSTTVLMANFNGTIKGYSTANTSYPEVFTTSSALYASSSATTNDKMVVNSGGKVFIIDDSNLYGYVYSGGTIVSLTGFPMSEDFKAFRDIDCTVDKLYISTVVDKGSNPYYELHSYDISTGDMQSMEKDGINKISYNATNADLIGCQSLESQVIVNKYKADLSDEPCANLVVDAGSDLSLCPGNEVSVGGNPTAQGGSGSYTYSWTAQPTVTPSGISNPIFSGISENTEFTVEVTDVNNTLNCKFDKSDVTMGCWPVTIEPCFFIDHYGNLKMDKEKNICALVRPPESSAVTIENQNSSWLVASMYNTGIVIFDENSNFIGNCSIDDVDDEEVERIGNSSGSGFFTLCENKEIYSFSNGQSFSNPFPFAVLTMISPSGNFIWSTVLASLYGPIDHLTFSQDDDYLYVIGYCPDLTVINATTLSEGVFLSKIDKTDGRILSVTNLSFTPNNLGSYQLSICYGPYGKLFIYHYGQLFCCETDGTFLSLIQIQTFFQQGSVLLCGLNNDLFLRDHSATVFHIAVTNVNNTISLSSTCFYQGPAKQLDIYPSTDGLISAVADPDLATLLNLPVYGYIIHYINGLNDWYIPVSGLNSIVYDSDYNYGFYLQNLSSLSPVSVLIGKFSQDGQLIEKALEAGPVSNSSSNQNFLKDADVDEKDDIVIYPNPVNGQFIIDNIPEGKLAVELINSSGVIISSHIGLSDSGKIKISAKGLSSGVYFARINTRSKAICKRIIIL